jgi:hypothetical protein
MGQSKKARPRKRAGRSKILTWMIAAAAVGLAGYGLSQMSNIAYGEAGGCGMTLAQCVATDSTCPVREDNITRIRRIVDQTARSKS